jgi:hypothetical protein
LQPATLDLNNCIGNDNGTFDMVGGENFVANARSIALEPDTMVFTCELRNCSGEWKAASLHLDALVGNQNGVLVFEPPSVSLPMKVRRRPMREYLTLDEDPAFDGTGWPDVSDWWEGKPAAYIDCQDALIRVTGGLLSDQSEVFPGSGEAATLLAGPKVDPGMVVSKQIGNTAFWNACLHGHTEVVRHLLSLPDAVAYAAQTDWEGWSPLFAAVFGGHADTVKLLVQHPLVSKFNLALRARFGNPEHKNKSPLEVAEAAGDIEVADILRKGKV